LVGVGPGNGQDVYGLRFEIHNTYVNVLVEEGLLGTVLLFGIFVVSFQAGVRMVRMSRGRFRAVGIGLLSGQMTLLAYGVTMYGLRQRELWIMVGLLVASERAARMTRRSRSVAVPDQEGARQGM